MGRPQMKKCKTLILLTTDLISGGVAEASYKFIKIFKHIKLQNPSIKNLKLIVISYEPIALNYENKLMSYKENDVELYSLNLKLWKNYGKTKREKIHRSITRLFDFPLAYLKLKYFIKKYKPYCIVSFGSIPNIINIHMNLFFKYKAVCVERSYPDLDLKGGILKKFLLKYLEILYRFNKHKVASIAISKPIYNWYKTLGLQQIYYIPNAIDFEEIKNKSKENIGDIENLFKYPVLINIGRLTKQKGQWYLIRVFKKLKKDFPELKLLILGEGELKVYLTQLSQKLGLKTYVWDKDELSENFDVYFLGFQENPFKYISKAKLFVFPSLWEGFPNALIEAMACGVPVISSDCRSGPREILAPDTDFRKQTKQPEYAKYGVLMPVFEGKILDENAPLTEVEKIWVNELKKILQDEKLRNYYAKKAIIRAKEFSIPQIAKLWEEIIYDKCYNERK
jgi:glycosyltransferase involved in cell wall biosynthesis